MITVMLLDGLQCSKSCYWVFYNAQSHVIGWSTMLKVMLLDDLQCSKSCYWMVYNDQNHDTEWSMMDATCNIKTYTSHCSNQVTLISVVT